MNSNRIENLTVLAIFLVVASVIYVLLYHPEWVIWLLTYQETR